MGHAGSVTERVQLDQCISQITAFLLLISFVDHFPSTGHVQDPGKDPCRVLPGICCHLDAWASARWEVVSEGEGPGGLAGCLGACPC